MKALILFAAAIVTGSVLKAQTFNEGESIREQLKKGTVPGLRFAPVTATYVKQETDIRKKESLIAQIRKGTAPNMKFQSGGGAARRATPATQKVTKQGLLPSELEKPKVLPKVDVKPVVPTQEEQ
jgi:hypothetical protein